MAKRSHCYLVVSILWMSMGCDKDILVPVVDRPMDSMFCGCNFFLPDDIPVDLLPLAPSSTCTVLNCMCDAHGTGPCASMDRDDAACSSHIASETDQCGLFNWPPEFDPDLIPLSLLDGTCPNFNESECILSADGRFCLGETLEPEEARERCRQICVDMSKSLDFELSALLKDYECGDLRLALNAPFVLGPSGRDKTCELDCSERSCTSANLDSCTIVETLTESEVQQAELPYTCSTGYRSPRPFCRVPDIDPPVLEAGGIFAERRSRRSLGVVDRHRSMGTLQIDDNRSASSIVEGQVDILGEPCPNCPVSFRLTVSGSPVDVDDLHVDELHLSGGTGTAPIINLDDSGRGIVGPGRFSGTLSMRVDGDAGFLAGPSLGVLNVRVQREQETFRLWGFLAFETEEDDFLSLTVDIGGAITNQPPIADAGPDETLECTGPSGSVATLQGQVSDLDGFLDLRGTDWFVGPAFSGPGGGRPIAPWFATHTIAPLGSTTYSLRAYDSHLQTHTDSKTVTVVDTTPPTVESFSYDGPACLWAPNHKYVILRVGRDFSAMIADVCDPNPQLVVMNASSDQPDNATDDGNTSNDAVVFADRVCLRSERQGGDQNGRLYTVQLAAVDRSGNASDPTVQIRVGHDERPSDRCGMVLDELEVVPEGHPLCEPDEPNNGRNSVEATSGSCSSMVAHSLTALILFVCLCFRCRRRAT